MAKINQKIKINITSEEAQELMEGAKFEWCFPTDKGEDIDVEIYGSDDACDHEETEGECEWCGEKVCGVCHKVEDEDGRCGCTNKDAK